MVETNGRNIKNHNMIYDKLFSITFEHYDNNYIQINESSFI